MVKERPDITEKEAIEMLGAGIFTIIYTLIALNLLQPYFPNVLEGTWQIIIALSMVLGFITYRYMIRLYRLEKGLPVPKTFITKKHLLALFIRGVIYSWTLLLFYGCIFPEVGWMLIIKLLFSTTAASVIGEVVDWILDID